jgi:hypothetical protein
MWHKHQQERKPMMEPLLLLDFDGVLNAFPDDMTDPLATHPDWQDWAINTVNGFATVTSRSMAATAAALANTRWLTTWNESDKANTLLSPLLGIGPFEVAAVPPLKFDADPLWKPRAVAEVLATGSRVLWFDDEAELLWQDWGRNIPPNLFIIAPDCRRGLTRHELEKARVWLSPKT